MAESIELTWVHSNLGLLDHILFFNRFDTYTRRCATSRFKSVVNNYIEDRAKRQKLLADYESWKNTEEARSYWEQRFGSEVSSDLGTSSVMFSSVVSTVNCKDFIKYIKTRALVSPILDNYYGNEDITKNERKENFLPFRKMKLSSYINQAQADKRLSRNLKKKFGDDCVLIFGDWSAPIAKFHEPIKGKGMRRMLRNQGHKAYLVNEYKTSSICPSCGSELEKFKKCISPRPYQCLKCQQ